MDKNETQKKSSAQAETMNTTQTPFPADLGDISVDSLEPVNETLPSTPGIDMSMGPALTDASLSLCEPSEKPEGKYHAKSSSVQR